MKKVKAFAVVASLFFFSGSNLLADGKQEKPKPAQSRLMMMNADGSDVQELFRSDKFILLGSAAFSPDGKQVLMDGWDKPRRSPGNIAHVLVINADGTNLKDLGKGVLPSWSPDATQITFTQTITKGIWIMNVDGTNRELIDKNGLGGRWSPDGIMIAYREIRSINREEHMKIYNTQEDTFRYVFPFGKNPYSSYSANLCWSPDSKSVCFRGKTKQGVYEIVTVKINKGIDGLKVHFSDPRRRPSADYSWHPDGKQILCILPSPSINTQKLFSFNPLNKQVLKLIPMQQDEKKIDDICWSPDGKKIIYTLVINP